jgi:alpha-amylase
MKRTLVKPLFIILASVLVLSACSAKQTQQPGVKGWWNDAVFYEIFVRSFYDSNGDGIGDINGLIEKLDYLNDGSTKTIDDLGVTGLWLMPIMPSPTYHGYDVTDYYSVNPDYGTNEDFKRLMDEAHKRGIRVIIDLVLNHTSSEHPWFQAARDPNSPYRDWYVWSDEDPGTLGPWDAKAWYPTANGYYYAIFWDKMPDLNYANPEVVAEMNKVAKFWLEEMGVDGFRLDAARYLVEQGEELADSPANHQYWKNFRLAYKDANPEAITVGEIWTSNVSVEDYLKGDELDLAFNFDLASQIIEKVNGGYGKQLQRDIRSTVETFQPGTYATFLTNHDQNRLMNEVAGKWERAKMAATVLLTLPGTPFLYYGEEIGMTGTKPDEKIRTPMQWSADKSAGFSSTFPWESINADYTEKNVAQQSNDLDSLLSVYRALIYLRSNHPALRTGDFIPVETSNNAVLAFLRVQEQDVVLVLINLGTRNLTDLTVSLAKGPLSGSYAATVIYGNGQPGELAFDSQGGFTDYRPTPELAPSSSLIIQLKK